MHNTRNAFCGTWYLPHSHVTMKELAGCIAHARNGHSTSGLNYDVIIVFLGPDFLQDAKI